ncbi:MAG: hypothetical protein AUK60_01455 [Rhodobacteraceae bacterium CG2_30_10_405]|nr:hypothetical protein [Rhodobacterales bacterium]NCO16384.1 hypothetical protein [Alphaproteobacteria bacterium]OIQ07325.1 MAG: hypothetical protein AUK60_01455 [Rhodobacteraceae bacterium CG2_30_10_405]
MFKRLLTLAALFGAAGAALPLHAQAACTNRSALIEQLMGRHSEELSALGYQTGAQVMEIWSSPKTGTWTVLITHPDGISCVVASGTNWTQHIFTPLPPGVGS